LIHSSPPIKEDFINLVVPNNAGDGRSTRVLELGREIVLKYKANLLRWKKNYSKCGPLFVAFEYIDIWEIWHKQALAWWHQGVRGCFLLVWRPPSYLVFSLIVSRSEKVPWDVLGMGPGAHMVSQEWEFAGI